MGGNSLEQPERNNNIPNNAEWLGGVGEGAWFHIQKYEEEGGEYQNLYRIQRWGADGKMHCDRIFKEEASAVQDNGYHDQKRVNKDEYIPFSIDKDYSFTYVSHCLRCTIKQDGRLYGFVYIKEYDAK